MITALILSGGTGTRLGSDIPKQYIMVNDRPIISYCLETIINCKKIDAVQIVAAKEWRDLITEWVERYDFDKKFRGFSDPGENRQLSIFNGLCDIGKGCFDDCGDIELRKPLKGYSHSCSENDYVIIHDAARPLLTQELLESCLDGAQGHDGAMPVLPMKDTVYSSCDGKIVSGLLKRSEIYAGQAPEVFRLGKYYEANLKLMPERIYSINGSAEPAIMAGMDVAMIPGDEGNYKITTAADLERFKHKYERTPE